MTKLRTTLMIPEEDIKQIKLIAATQGMTMSEVVVKSVRKAANLIYMSDEKVTSKTWRDAAGSLSLGGIEPTKRADLYDKHLQSKSTN